MACVWPLIAVATAVAGLMATRNLFAANGLRQSVADWPGVCMQKAYQERRPHGHQLM